MKYEVLCKCVYVPLGCIQRMTSFSRLFVMRSLLVGPVEIISSLLLPDSSTETDTFLGTPGPMSPLRIQGKKNIQHTQVNDLWTECTSSRKPIFTWEHNNVVFGRRRPLGNMQRKLLFILMLLFFMIAFTK